MSGCDHAGEGDLVGARLGLTFLVATVGTALVAYSVKAMMPVRITPEEEHSGLDLCEHGEEGYIL